MGSLEDVHLVMAGGYDERVRENKEHYKELCALRSQLGLDSHVTFLRSISHAQKATLLKYSTCLIYTPDNEHFGIVPIEAMYMQCPVIAVASGGPLETVKNGQTGFLCQPHAEEFSDAMINFLQDRKLSSRLGEAGHDRVIRMFSFAAFTQQLDGIVQKMCENI